MRGGHNLRQTKEQREEILRMYLEDSPAAATALAISRGLSPAYAYRLAHERGLIPITRYVAKAKA
jgi:hypothetical protein